MQAAFEPSLPRGRLAWCAAFVILVLAASPVAAQRAAHDLPDIGDPAAAVLPLSQERRLGPVILRQLRAQLPIVADVELNEYLSSLGDQLLSVHADHPLDFHFLLVARPQINAFATPGGVIAINVGLLLAAESESELAGVLAHEIAHVTQRHLARLLAESKRMSWVGLLATVGAVLAATYDSRLAQLGARVGAALPIERALSYSRAFERESDRLGMKRMAAAGHDPKGMIRFFQRLQARTGSGGPPEFLRTHPLTVERISDAQNLAASYRGEYRESSRAFAFAKARLEALTNPRRAMTAKARTAVERYRRAVALTREGRAREAVRALEGIAQNDRTAATSLALARAYLTRGDARAAIRELEPLSRLYPERESVAYHVGDALVRAKRPDEALDRLRPFAHGRHAPALDRLIAKAAADAGKTWLSHRHLAAYYQANGRMQEALDQLTLAEKDPQISRSARALIRTEREKLERLRKEMEQGPE